MAGQSEQIPRRDYIASVMAKQGIQRHPRKYIVLRGWNTIVDHDRTYEVQVPELPPRFTTGMEVYAITKPDTPELDRVRIVEDRGEEGLFIQPLDYDYQVQLLVGRESIKMLPIPLRPLAILRSELNLYIGDQAAEVWSAQRANRSR